jgi:hypothetical protein
MVEIVFVTGTRSGSEFLIQTTRHALRPTKPDLMESFADLTPGRRDMANPSASPQFDHLLSEQRAMAYFVEHGYRTCKIEHPGLDLLAVELMAAFPAARFLSIVRPIEWIVRSHQSLAWGVRPDVAVNWWVQDIAILNFLNRHGRLFTISLEDRSAFDAEAFCAFLGVPVAPPILFWAELWPKVNPSDHVASREQPADQRLDAPTKEELIAKFPIIPEIEEQYLALLER